MQIISFVFFGLTALVFLVIYGVNKFVRPDKKAILISNAVLLLASFAFVAWADYRFAVILAALCLSTWFFAKQKRTAIGIVVAVLALAFFKYTNFFIESFARIIGKDYTALKIILPLGISFYTFSAISYLVDVKRGKTEAKDLLSVALYLAYFPKITSGPIQKSKDFFDQIGKKRPVGWPAFSAGIQIFMFGLFKKIVLADRLSVFVNQVYETPSVFSSATVFLATIAYSLQIYFDFSGYSDMAIGVSKILGIDLPRNFNLPYIAHNVTELWKRWHITLSSWLQEYLYISLGGNRKGTVRTYINLVLTMLIGGLWHGASWPYVFWGLLHGLALAVHKAWMKITGSAQKQHSVISNCLSIAVTFLFTNFVWVFFRAESVQQAFKIIQRIFCFDAGISQPYMWLFIALVILLAATVTALCRSGKKPERPSKTNVSYIDGYYPLLKLDSFWGLVIFFVFVGLILSLAYTGGSPFIYGNY